MVDCKSCGLRFRADQVPESCKKRSHRTRQFNLMFKTNVGPVDDGSSYAYLRPETAQQIFTNFKNVVDSSSSTLPFGIAQIGKAFKMKLHQETLYFEYESFNKWNLNILCC